MANSLSILCLLTGTFSSVNTQELFGFNLSIFRSANSLINCTHSPLDSFPKDLFSESQREHGAVVLHIILAIYCFAAIAKVCNDYFLPSVNYICIDLRIPPDLAAATFMATATSAPELFVNIVGTFITETDVGIGTVVGSALFNSLGVAAITGLAARKEMRLDWWPLVRDCSIYSISLVILFAIVWDGKVFWYEGAALMALYFLYFVAMAANSRLRALAKCFLACFRPKTKIFPGSPTSEANQSQEQSHGVYTIYANGPPNNSSNSTEVLNDGRPSATTMISQEDEFSGDDYENLTQPPQSWHLRIWWLLMWPLTCLLYLSIPDCRKLKRKRFYPLSFVMCVVWIGISSYVVAWMITIIGDTFEIPDSVMGITFLAAGGSLPEAISSYIMVRKGIGGMGISNSVGANTLDILLCLGLPWLIKSSLLAASYGPDGFIEVISGGVTYNIGCLIVSVAVLLSITPLFKYKINRRMGLTFLTFYLIFIVFTVLIESNVFFVVNPPVCSW